MDPAITLAVALLALCAAGPLLASTLDLQAADTRAQPLPAITFDGDADCGNRFDKNSGLQDVFVSCRQRAGRRAAAVTP